MKSAMPYRGVPSPVLKTLWRQLFSAHPLTSAATWQAVALTLWREARYREERYAAIALTDLPRYRTYRTPEALPMLEEMIVTGAWWDLVDALATHHLGDVLRSAPARVGPLMRRWAVSSETSSETASWETTSPETASSERPSPVTPASTIPATTRPPALWKRRAAILCQIRFKADTDLDLLYSCIEPNLAHPDFFIRKAIGWSLRQYAWVDAREVARYVKANRNRLSPLSVREALKNVS